MERNNKFIIASKPLTYDPQSVCFKINPTNAQRVKAGNRRIDCSTMDLLRAENAKKKVNDLMTVSKISSLKKIKAEDIFDPFKCQPTRPTRMGVKKNIEKETASEQQHKDLNHKIKSEEFLESTSETTKRTSEPLEKQQDRKKIRLSIVTERDDDGNAVKRSSKILCLKNQ